MGKKNGMKYIYPKEIQKRIYGEYDDKIQIGYDKIKIQRKEGERWTDENGKQWEMKDGIIQSVPKFQDIRVPLFCPKCNRVMGKRSKDVEVYHKFGFCLECLIDRDAKMIEEGIFDEYQKKYINSKKKGFYEDTKLQIEEYLKKLERGYLEYVNEDGKIEKWEGEDVEKIKKFWVEELEFVNKEIEKLQNDLGEKNNV